MKAQIVSLDFVVAITVFAILFYAGITMWNDYSRDLEKSYSTNELRMKAYGASVSLMDSSGQPFNWSIESNRAGVKDFENIDSGKLERMIDYASNDYENSKKLLGLQEYDYRIIVNYSNGTNIYDSGESYALADEIVAIKRLALMKGDGVNVKLIVWREK
ncbi:MAG: hypothetical protein GOU97_04430 [Nanoarchaeota archaeon]|nr:hypothetical protein [Nanoarchaeota archaeon]